MPMYQYACPDCGVSFERKQKFTDDPIKVCPTCQKTKVYRVINRVAVTFSGSGFYVNDSKSSSSTLPVAPKPATETGDASAEAKENKSASNETKASESSAASNSDSKASEPAKTEKAEKPATAPAKSG